VSDKVDVAAITRQRLHDWDTCCIRDHATPGLLLAIGHDAHSGETHIYVPDDPYFNEQTIAQMLRIALRELSRR
jgi:hypothetical protein